MQKSITIILFCLGIQFFVGAQKPGVESIDEDAYGQFPKEKVFMHHNASMLLVGDYLYYSTYVLRTDDNTLSDISKIAYVVLIGENGDKVFEHKVKLSDGLGRGEFFVPVSVLSGNYKLIGYTQWMTNWNENSFFSSDIVIINPYTNNQSALRVASESDTISDTYENDRQSIDKSALDLSSKATSSNIQIVLDKENLSKREKVSLGLKATSQSIADGNYSISVRRRTKINSSPMIGAEKFVQELSQLTDTKPTSKEIVLPELRGHLISGRITATNEKASVRNQKVFFSIPGQEYELKVLTTDQNGSFNFSLDKRYLGEKGFFQVLSDDPADYAIRIEDRFSIDHTQFDFEKFKLRPDMKSLLVEGSIYNQIENAYFKAKPDTLKIIAERLPFYGKPEIIYDLDDYTRFKTVKETFVEIVNNVWLARDKNDKAFLSVRDLYSSDMQTAYRTLVIVDGFILQDIDPLLSFDSRKIKSVKILRNKYILGSQIFQGVIDMETFDTNFYELVNFPYAKEITLFKPLPLKTYFRQEYDTKDGLNNIPDYRQQLLWIPHITLNSEDELLEFFTSDVVGDFEISMEGFSKEGKPISLKKTFTVK